MNSPTFALTLAIATTASMAADRGNPDLHTNQVGYLPDLPKLAILRAPPVDSSFQVITEPGATVVFEGFGSRKEYWAPADDTIRRYDFSPLTTPSTYRVQVPGKGVSYPFKIEREVYTDVTKAAIKSYYYQRASTPLLAAHAGIYARAAGHPDNAVRVHNSAATAQRPANSTISSPKGWYDAGDYGKYVVNSGITTWTLLQAYLLAPGYFDTLKLNIPESGNGLPDLIDEILWNVDWVLTMQDLDGGVYHKLTTANFSGFVMPADDKAARYVVQKGTAATLDFAALMAQTSRIFRRFEAQRPGFADSCLAASKRAWAWALANPSVAYDQAALTSPTVSTGGYGDGSFTDEKIWAAMELTLATRDTSYWMSVFPGNKFAGSFGNPGWNQVASLGLMSSLMSIDSLVGLVDTAGMRAKMQALGTTARSRMTSNPYRVPVSATDMYWGSTSVTGNHALSALHWYRLSKDTTFRTTALTALDWIFGRNALGVSFVTGTGTVSPMFPHHRPSGADGIAAPIPGLIVGGPNARRDDATGCADAGFTYPYELPALSWIDAECSYASNEVAINWNAPLVALLGGLQGDAVASWTLPVTPRTAQAAARLVASRVSEGIRVRSLDGTALLEVRLLDASGRTLERVQPEASEWSFRTSQRGMLVVQARTAQGWSSALAGGL